jgi:hypothetical protein
MGKKERVGTGIRQVIRIQGGPIFPLMNDRTPGVTTHSPFVWSFFASHSAGSGMISQGLHSLDQHHSPTPQRNPARR